ncbi:MAG TPA: phospholipase D family protein [Spirochaetota bacterium]|nr:phospholipase D family protein [Spirochaetota bacterium]
MGKTEFITDTEIYDKVIIEKIPSAKKFLWIATSDIKDLHVKKGKSMVPFLEILSGLLDKNVLIRLIHAKEPGPNFRKDFDRYPNLIGGLERILCPRVHFKSVIIDGNFIYTGSANLTGAGMGAKSSTKRNFESGIISDDTVLVKQVMEQFDAIWMGSKCKKCKRKQFCADYEMLK